MGEDYGKELVPRSQNGSPVLVYLNVSVLAFPTIDTSTLSFTADFFLNLRWRDLRLEFQDLNNVTTLNILSAQDKAEIWAPQLAFTNALGPFQTEVDALTSGVLIREGPPLAEDIGLETEGNLRLLFYNRVIQLFGRTTPPHQKMRNHALINVY